MSVRFCVIGAVIFCVGSAEAQTLAQSTSEINELFLKYDYAETKDLSKSFLTLVAAILVFSLTFSEKIVDFPRARPAARYCLLASWCLFIASITLCGLAICYISLAGGNAVYGGSFFELAQIAYLLLLLAGTFFTVGLILLIISAAYSINRRADVPPLSSPSPDKGLSREIGSTDRSG
jgi:hypothetical protein